MQLEGLHHITMITEDAPRCVEFYADLLGLRLVKKTVNFDAPDVYHLYFGDESGAPGSILTWFEFPDAARGRAGAGMIHRIELAVADEAALEFWEARLTAAGYPPRRDGSALLFEDYDGLGLALVPAGLGNPPLAAGHPEVPAESAIAGVERARAYARGPVDGERPLLTETLGFERGGDGYLVRGERRSFEWAYDPAPAEPGLQGAGSVHHIAFACRDEDQLEWQQRARDAGAHVTEVLDREYFESIYFREPEGVLFEIATLSPGFAVDEDPAHLGERLCLPPQYEAHRERLEELLTPLPKPRR